VARAGPHVVGLVRRRLLEQRAEGHCGLCEDAQVAFLVLRSRNSRSSHFLFFLVFFFPFSCCASI
jgi:hypothetical protein